ncbi:carbonic anhydrase [Eremomyces bilateralis CBS 781.70]|uniref:Carbonic anhydrase n=1 Tax=Eremomyces bilateralis CBS 781.70 TaxID=1392243 RepID=A0A6G1G6Q8_9PEZI|nr:carbonic anhydrase [Eremomyces bilateralis CBS 781.70]KAF1813616.1 carbonic anhydrase [Eremomyces bilateralis CBS 781.70]
MKQHVPPVDQIERILQGNKAHARRTLEADPEFFKGYADKQRPGVLWIGCADSRVPETTISDSKPGEIFVHRNIANVVNTDEVGANSVLDFAVGNVKVQKIVVCGHTNCGGAAAALGDANLGPNLNKWIEPLRELRKSHQGELDKLKTDYLRGLRVVELNVQRSVKNVKANATVQQAMKGRGLTVHGFVYDIPTGELRALDTAE